MENIFNQRTVRTDIEANLVAVLFEVACEAGESAEKLAEMYNVIMFSAMDAKVKKKRNKAIGAKDKVFCKKGG